MSRNLKFYCSNNNYSNDNKTIKLYTDSYKNTLIVTIHTSVSSVLKYHAYLKNIPAYTFFKKEAHKRLWSPELASYEHKQKNINDI